MKRIIGLHMRLAHSFSALIEKAQQLELDTLQCFFIVQQSGNLLPIKKDDLHKFLTIRRQYFKQIYAHGSYWINLASIEFSHHYSLKNELEYAKRLEFDALILHAGSAKGAVDKQQGIDAVVRVLNKVLKKENQVRIVLENSAHNKLCVGGDLHDFAQILQRLDHPEKLVFCIDTAHAHSYGYNLLDAQGQVEFMHTINATIGFEKVALLHLNDTTEKMGSFIDRHGIVGQGQLGQFALPHFIKQPALQHVPIILELPAVPEETEIEVLSMVRRWCDNL